MKYRLGCVLFGHVFTTVVKSVRKGRENDLYLSEVLGDFVYSRVNTSECVNCGLTKEECGITTNKSIV